MMNSFEILKKFGFEPFHPAVTALSAFRGGMIHTEIAPDSARFKNAAFLFSRLAYHGAPVTEEHLKRWFMSIVVNVKTGNMAPEEIVARSEGIVFAFEGKPSFLFDEDLAREVILKCEWTPMAAEIWRFAEPGFTEFENLRMDLNRMLGRFVYEPLPPFANVQKLGWDQEPPRVTPIRITRVPPAA